MSSTSETGHAKNVANVSALTAILEGFGGKYNPVRESIQLSALRDLENRCREALSTFNAAQPPYVRAVSERNDGFKPLSSLAGRVVNSLMATDAPAHVGQAARSLAKKIAGTRPGSAKAGEQNKEPAGEEKAGRGISTSQTSFDSRLDNFDKLVKLLENTPEYAPNEEELQTESLSTLHGRLSELNRAAISAAATFNNARNARNGVLYDPQNGIIASVAAVKKYLRSVYTVGSSQYKQISRLQFAKIA